jgi:hypothetical protein
VVRTRCKILSCGGTFSSRARKTDKSRAALLPAWLGISLVFGFSDGVVEKAASSGGNLAALVVGDMATYAVLAFRGDFSYRLARRREYEL